MMRNEIPAAEIADIPSDSVIRIEAARNWVSVDVQEIWDYRELLYFLIWRDVKVRYKQTVLGLAWAVLQPITTMVIFTVVFGWFFGSPSDGFPYPVFAFAALLPWNYFAGALSRATNGVVAEAGLISKVYFPRLIIPLAGAISPTVDLAVSFLVLLGMMFYYRIAPHWGILVLPAFLLLAAATALGVGLWLSALNARYRDIGHLIPFLIQTWMYASPVAYPVSKVPAKWRLIYSLNPMVGVIEGFRWGLLGKETESFSVIAVSSAVVLILLLSGLAFFKRMEQSFADLL
jgi:lipopolysaccharide transport system permease protein